MAGDTVPSAALHRGAMSYERPGAGRDFTGATGCRRAFFRGAGLAGSTGFRALGGPALRGGRCGSRAAAARGRYGADAGPDAGTGARASGTAAGSAAPDGGNRTNGRAAAVGSGGRPGFPAGAGAARGASGAGEGCTVTHPEAMTSATSVRGRARRSCIRPPCRTGAARTGARHTVG